ncbi:hypothetical protein DES53_115150 [Roseimicrobium gellanilyticum]|uniref:N-acetyltransferase domain-containing protein n=1 Tax=Roseimicrobium gellanilyticum TaxID=748857 RepID=A0A366H522_9BACT|nr:hypothetical protein DES53_115150 [Roseimicrobium gellanilyticum]
MKEDEQERGVWRAREYGEKVGDYQMISEWREGHNVGPLPETVIPPLALVCERDGEPMAFACCYQSYGIGVCFLEWLITRPGLNLAEARLALEHVIRAIAACTKDTHALMFGYCVPALAREAKRNLGFKGHDVPHYKLFTRID